MSDDLNSRLNFAVEVSSLASELILSHWRQAGLAVELKADESPVTIADRGAEQLLRERILHAFPGDGVLGEEFGETAGTSGFRWVLDPVDGTKSFVAGVPLFGTLIAVEQAGRPVIGVCRFPALGEVVYAARGRGAWWTIGGEAPRPARVSTNERLEDSLFCFTSVGGWESTGRMDAFLALCRTARLTRGWGDCYGHILVATGRAELAVDPLLNLWDAAALLPIVEEAGGVFCDWTGAATAEGGNGFSTTPALRDHVLALLSGARNASHDRSRD
ncbi:MAG: histidinol-phosphatase [Planctomyces sp.]|nr:histidinol-phosphatase [Planctomyces sp.]